MEKLLNAIFTPTCLFCGATGKVFCNKCLSKCFLNREGFCLVCEKPVLNGKTHVTCLNSHIPVSVYSAFIYEDLVRKCIKKAKYGSRQFAALNILIRNAINWTSRCGNLWDNCLIIPIPLSKKRISERGFNQAELIATSLSKEYKLRAEFLALQRQKNTKVQFENSRQERFKNLHDAFIADPKKVSGEKILLVDDICTSGATLLEASKALYNANCREVHCFTLARRPMYLKASNFKSKQI
jgi:ComF family protein